MNDGVWGDVKDWGLEDHSDGSLVISIDPVCGKQVNEAKAAGRVTYSGVAYHFCSKECKKLFEQAPGEYTGHVLRGPVMRIVNINASNLEELRTVFPVGDDSLNLILKNRPYQSWADFKTKNPGFSDPMLRGIRESGVIIGIPGLNSKF
jgi:YHS domain-containing protein